jgi:alpha-galactosidase
LGISRIQIQWRVRLPSGARILGDAWERSYGDLEWRGIVPCRIMPWYFLVFDGRQTCGIGVKTGAGAFCCWQADQEGFSLLLDTRSGGRGVRLAGRQLCAAEIVWDDGAEAATPYQSAGRFMPLLCAKPLLPTMPVYGCNDWYYAYGNNSAARIIEDSQFCSDLAENTRNRPFSMVELGWQFTGVGGAPWSLGGKGFPDMPGLAAKIRRAGCRPGIWFRPLLTSANYHDARALKLCRATRFKAHPAPGEIILDPTDPANLDQIRNDVRHFRQWGYELIKHDFSTWDAFGRWGFQMEDGLTEDGWSFQDVSRTNAEIVQALYRAIREAAAGALVLGCNTVGHLIAGQAHLQRTGDDTSGKEWARTRKMGVNTLAFRACQNRAFFALDADCVGITERIPWRLNAQWLDLLSRSGTPLFVSAKREVIGRGQKKALRQAFSRASVRLPTAEPLDWLETTCPTRWRLAGETAVFNWSE